MIDFTKNLIKKHNLLPNSYYQSGESPYSNRLFVVHPKEEALKEKWKSRVSQGWYGFSLTPCPELWFDVLDEWLNEAVKSNPNLEILQISVKFGYLKCYLKNISEEAQQSLRLLVEVLGDKLLIY